MRLGMGLGLGNLLSGQPLTGFPNDFSFNLDGSNDYLELPAMSPAGTQSIAFWFKIENVYVLPGVPDLMQKMFSPYLLADFIDTEKVVKIINIKEN